MLTHKDILEFCRALPLVYEDYPFHDDTLMIRRKDNTKGFVLFGETEGKESVNLKCEPMRAQFYRQVYKGVIPGYHMNKTHWNTVLLGGDVPREAVLDMVRESYELTRPKAKRKNGSNEAGDIQNGSSAKSL